MPRLSAPAIAFVAIVVVPAAAVLAMGFVPREYKSQKHYFEGTVVVDYVYSRAGGFYDPEGQVVVTFRDQGEYAVSFATAPCGRGLSPKEFTTLGQGQVVVSQKNLANYLDVIVTKNGKPEKQMLSVSG